MSVRAEILNLLADLRRTRGISVLLIAHDLSTVATFADRIAVMYLGRVVELGPAREVISNPQHPYTQALLSVVPVANPRLRRRGAILSGETPNPINIAQRLPLSSALPACHRAVSPRRAAHGGGEART